MKLAWSFTRDVRSDPSVRGFDAGCRLRDARFDELRAPNAASDDFERGRRIGFLARGGAPWSEEQSPSLARCLSDDITVLASSGTRWEILCVLVADLVRVHEPARVRAIRDGLVGGFASDTASCCFLGAMQLSMRHAPHELETVTETFDRAIGSDWQRRRGVFAALIQLRGDNSRNAWIACRPALRRTTDRAVEMLLKQPGWWLDLARVHDALPCERLTRRANDAGNAADALADIVEGHGGEIGDASPSEFDGAVWLHRVASCVRAARRGDPNGAIDQLAAAGRRPLARIGDSALELEALRECARAGGDAVVLESLHARSAQADSRRAKSIESVAAQLREKSCAKAWRLINSLGTHSALSDLS